MKEAFTLENFRKALRISQNHILAGFVNDIFQVVNSKKCDIKQLMQNFDRYYNNIIDIYEIFCYDSNSLEIVKKLLKDNRKVYAGSFEDKGLDNPIELYLCYSKILISNRDIYLESLEEY
jgi:hypothetical protein